MACILFIILIIILLCTLGPVVTAALLVIAVLGWGIVKELID